MSYSRAAAHEPFAELVVYRVEDDDAARRSTALSRVRERRRERPVIALSEIGVVADDERVLAAELEADLREPPRRPLVDDRPVAAEPVKLTRSTSGCSTSGAPASSPSPCTTLTTPAGSPTLQQTVAKR